MATRRPCQKDEGSLPTGTFLLWAGGFPWREWGGFEDFHLTLELSFVWGVVALGCALRRLGVGRNDVRGAHLAASF